MEALWTLALRARRTLRREQVQYQVKVEGESLDVEILHERGSWRARVGEGPWQEVDLRTPEPGVLSLLIISLEASLAGGERGDWQVDIYGQTYACEVVDPRRAALEMGGGR